MSKSIPISPKHGVNPAIPRCFWCGQHKNEIALLGKLPGDAKAPDVVITNMEPCDTCRANMDKGITLLAVTKNPIFKNQQPAAQDENGTPLYYYPNYIVTTPEFITRNWPPEIAQTVLEKRIGCMPKEEIEGLVQQMNQIAQEVNENA